MAYAKPTTIVLEKVPCTSNSCAKAAREFMEAFVDGIEGAEVIKKNVTASISLGNNSQTFTDEELYFAKVGTAYVTFIFSSTTSVQLLPMFYKERADSYMTMQYVGSSYVSGNSVDASHLSLLILKTDDANFIFGYGYNFFFGVFRETFFCCLPTYSTSFGFYYYDQTTELLYDVMAAGASYVFGRVNVSSTIVTLIKAHANFYSDIDIPCYFVDAPSANTYTKARFLHIGGYVYFEFYSNNNNINQIRLCVKVGTLD